MPLTSENEQLFDDIAKRNNLQVKGIHGIYDVSNKRRLAITEWYGVTDLISGCKELIATEPKLQNERYDGKEQKQQRKNRN